VITFLFLLQILKLRNSKSSVVSKKESNIGKCKNWEHVRTVEQRLSTGGKVRQIGDHLETGKGCNKRTSTYFSLKKEEFHKLKSFALGFAGVD